MKKIIPLLICLAFASTASASTIFSCDLSNKHNVSIDSSNQLGLAYDYGKVDATKSDLTLDNKNASYGSYLGPSWSYQYFRFARGEYSYVVYDRDGRTQGLAVYQGKKLLMNKKCTGKVEYDETGYAAASNQIKHDSEDDAFNFMPDDTSPPSDSPISSPATDNKTTIPDSQPSGSAPVMTGVLSYNGFHYKYDRVTKLVSSDGTPAVPMSSKFNELVAMGIPKKTATNLMDSISDIRSKLYVEQQNSNKAKMAAAEQAARDAIPKIAPPSDGSAPINVQLGIEQYSTVIRVTSAVDEVTVLGAKINRGNCPLTNGYTREGVLATFNVKFGQYVNYTVANSCNVMEVNIDTNMGAWQFKFNQ